MRRLCGGLGIIVFVGLGFGAVAKGELILTTTLSGEAERDQLIVDHTVVARGNVDWDALGFIYRR